MADVIDERAEMNGVVGLLATGGSTNPTLHLAAMAAGIKLTGGDFADLSVAFKTGELHRDFVAIVRFQGAKANGTPELHKLTPPLGVPLDLGYEVALVTDDRMSGASGKVPATIHVTPESAKDGPLARVQDGDMVRLDIDARTPELLADAEVLAVRPLATCDAHCNGKGTGRELFGMMRRAISGAEEESATFVMNYASA